MVRHAIGSAFLACLLVAAVVAPALAQPDPCTSNVPSIITVSPDGALTYSVTVNGPAGTPRPGDIVEVTFVPAAVPLMCWCTGTIPPTFAAVAGAGGVATFNIAAGGCVTAAGLGGTVAMVRAMPPGGAWVTLAPTAAPCVNPPLSVNSPDAVDPIGGPPCGVSLADAVFHTGPLATGTYSLCTDLSAPYGGTIDLSDAVVLTGYIGAGIFCP